MDADGTSSGGPASTTSASATGTGGSVTTLSTASGPSSTTDGSSITSAEESASGTTTGIDDGCPAGVGLDDLGAVSHSFLLGWDEALPFAGTCTAVEFTEGDLFLQCVHEGDPGRDVEVGLVTQGRLVVPESVAAMVGLTDLQVIVEPEYFSLDIVHDVSLRTSDGELLVLYVKGSGAPGDPVEFDVLGGTQPFESLELVDYGCDWVASDGGSSPFRRFALEVTGDDGQPLPLFHRQQATVIAGGHPYEVSLLRAVLYEDPCSKCASSAVELSIVRHP
jgi:hypothetical protein